jgi:hypothetical protein
LQKIIGTYTNLGVSSNNEKNDNGLQILAIHYQALFEIEENINYYSCNDYQSAKRKFMKYLMKSRAV